MTVLFATILAAAVAGSVEAADRSEVRLRSVPGAAAALDVETTPRLRLGLKGRHLALSAGYGPRLTLRDVRGESSRELLHQAAFEASTSDRLSRLALFGDATYGTLNYSYLRVDPSSVAPQGGAAGAAPLRVDRMPATSFSHLGVRAGFLATLRPVRRWTYAASFEYVANGGADAAARALVPLQQGPRGELALLHDATRRLQVGGAVGASRVWFSTGPETTWLEQTGRLRWLLGRASSCSLGAGVAETWSRNQDGATQALRLWPVLEGQLAHAPLHRLELRAVMRIAPVTDRLTGQVSERAHLTALVQHAISKSVGLRVLIGGVQSLPAFGPSALGVVLGEAALLVRVGPFLLLEGGTRNAWQSQQMLTTPTAMWVAFLTASITTTPLPF